MGFGGLGRSRETLRRGSSSAGSALQGEQGQRADDMRRRGGYGSARAVEPEVVVREPSALARFMLELDEQLPILRFVGFGFYYAWIWLSYNSTMLMSEGRVPADGAADSVFTMYLASTTALSLVLILAAVFTRFSTRVVESRVSVLAFAALAAASTLLVALSVQGDGAGGPVFLAAACLTGVGTAWVALRLGAVYATVPARKASLYTAASFMAACLLYFLAIGLPHEMGVVVTALLPVVAAACTMTTPEEQVTQVERPQRVRSLPKWFFLRFVLAVCAVSVVVGVTRGFSTLTQSAATLDEQGVLIVFGSACVAGVLYVLVSSLGGNFDVSKMYYPAIILVVTGISVMPLVGSGAFEGHFINIAYACFVLMVWCLCAHVSNMSGLAPVRVFGLGRGASALGTTVGWLIGSRIIAYQELNPSFILVVSVLMVLILLVVSMLVFNDRAIGSVLRMVGKNDGVVADDGLARGAAGLPDGVPGVSRGEAIDDDDPEDAASGAGEPDGHRKAGAFTKRCRAVSEFYKLSQRERDVLFLLAKGRTIGYIADDLNVSFNTAKSHIRHVYVKTGVHTRQELLDLIEKAEVGE